MAKSFIERLTPEQITAFLERQYPKEKGYTYGFIRTGESILVHVEQSKLYDYSFNCTLVQFDTTHFERHKQWIKYLYEIFGEEYKQAYLDYYAEIFN